MPWCEECAKYWAPSAMLADGTCPRCSRPVATPPITAKNLDLKRLANGDSDDELSAPWHFKLLIVMLAGYLGWRIVDLFV